MNNVSMNDAREGLCQKSDFGLAYHRLGSYHVSI